MKVKLYTLLYLLPVLALASLTASAAAITTYCGFEDNPVGGDKDYQDATCTITGATLHTSTGVFSVLTPSIVNDNGTPFWDHVSADGPNDNIGNIWLATDPGAEYLATPSGGIVSDVYFTGGASVTITGGQTSDHDTLGVCYVSNCAGTTTWITGASLTFTATGAFELVGKNGAGQEWYSDAAASGGASSFAFAQGTQAPEPQAWMLVLVGLGFVMISRRRTGCKVVK